MQPHRQILALFALAGVVAAPVVAAPVAQRTIIVAAAGGGDFRDIQPALDAAKPGDTVIVRKGSYNNAITSKGVRLLGEPGASISKYPPSTDLITVFNLPANQTFVLAGFDLRIINAHRPAALRLSGNRGRVHVESSNLSGVPYSNGGSPALLVEDCANVTVTGCKLVGEPGLLCKSSTIAIVDSSLAGQNAFDLRGNYSWRSYFGLEAESSRISLAFCDVRGGAGKVRLFGIWNASLAAVFRSCTTRIAGDTSAQFLAGDLPTGGAARSAIESNGGLLVIDPAVKLLPRGTTVAITGTTKVVKQRLPALKAKGAPPGSIVTTDVYSKAGETVLLFASLPGDRISTVFGDIWLDLRFLLLLDAGVQPPGQHRLFRGRLPASSSLRGLPIAFQALSGPAAVLPTASNPAIVVAF